MGLTGFRHHFLTTDAGKVDRAVDTISTINDQVISDSEDLEQRCREGIRTAVDRLNDEIRGRKSTRAVDSDSGTRNSDEESA